MALQFTQFNKSIKAGDWKRLPSSSSAARSVAPATST